MHFIYLRSSYQQVTPKMQSNLSKDNSEEIFNVRLSQLHLDVMIGRLETSVLSSPTDGPEGEKWDSHHIVLETIYLL